MFDLMGMESHKEPFTLKNLNQKQAIRFDCIDQMDSSEGYTVRGIVMHRFFAIKYTDPNMLH